MKFTVSALEVIFTSKPSQTNEDILKGCSYNSKQDMADFSYLLLNDTIRINYTTKADAGRTPDFILSSYRFRGRFQCVIFDENRMRKSVYSNYSDFISLTEPTFLRASLDIIPVRLTGGVQSTFTFPGGCQMTVPKQLKFKPSEVYWLKNGVKKTFFNLTQLKPVPSKNGFDVIYTFDNKARVVTREVTGVYQCVADFDGLDTPVIKRTFNVTVKVIEAKFVSNPSWQINKDNIQIQGCKYKAENPLYEHAYYLLNGEQKIRIGEINSETPSMFRKDEDGFYHLPPLTINSFDRLGTYECVITHALLEGQTISTASADLMTLKESDVLPTFKSHPTSAHSNTTGGVVQISGCIYHTKIPLSRSEQVFYLFNSVKKLGVPFPVLGAGDRGGGIDRSTTGVDEDSGFDPDRPLPREEREGGDFFRPSPDMRMIDYRKSTSSYEDQGFYQCGVTIGSGPYQKTILSNSVDVQFVDVASAKMNVRLDQQWDKDLANSSSETFKKLEKQLVEDIEKILSEENEVKPLVRILGFKSGSVIADTQVLYPNVTQTSRRQKCKELQQSLKDGVKNSQTFKVTSVDVNSLDCCSEDLEGEESFKGVERFPETLVSQSVTNNCTYKQSASSQRQCLGNMKDGPKWSNVNLQNCPAKSPITNSLIELSLKKICTPSTLTDCQTPVEVSGNLSQLINRTDSITTRQDLEYISIVLQNLAIHPTAFLPNDTDNAKTIVANVLETVGNVIGSNRTIVAQAQKAKQTSSNILKSLDVIAENLGQIAAFFNINGTIQIKFENPYVALAVTYTEPKPLKIFGGFDSDRSISVNIAAREDKPTYYNNKTLEILASSHIPKEAFRNKSQIVYSFLFQDDTLFLTGKQIKALDAGQPIVSPLSSQILAVTIGKDKLENLSIPILLKFEKIHQPVIGTEENSFFNNTCTFWEVQQVGLWSSRGCWKINETETQISCECNHLTNFAILLDVTGKQSNPLELRIMTWIGCGISLAGLFLTLLSYTIFKKLHKKLPPKILISLALSLFILLIVFLVGAERGSVVTSKLGCQIVAGILHYFMLTTFLWMLIEAINLYRNFVKIFRSGGDGKFFKNSSRIAWGIPLLIVVINGAVEPDNLGNDQFCVILGNSFYFALLLPVALILFINFIVLIMVLRSLSKNQGSKITSTQKQSLATQTRITLACATLLGLTWLFALLAVGDLSYTFQLLFTIFNSLQGFFIFVFYTLLNTDVQKEWKRLFKIKDKEQGNSSQPVVSTLNREKYHVKSSPTVGIYGNSDTPPAEEIDLSSSTGHLIKQRQHYTNPTYDQTDNSSFKK
uniref:Uncharacterized protein n=3 Tax=Clytia hemisphaerica TaxID=252671 RepID=A0A7M5V0Y8_9CNID